MRACRQLAQHCAMFCSVKSLISRLRRQLPHRGSPNDAQTRSGSAVFIEWTKGVQPVGATIGRPLLLCMGGRPMVAPTEWWELCTHRRAGARSRRRIQAFPVGEGGPRSAVDEGLQAAGTALCDVLLCKVPHQSPTAPASPPGKPKRRTNPVGVGASMTRLCLSLSLPQALTRQLPRQEEPMLVCA